MRREKLIEFYKLLVSAYNNNVIYNMKPSLKFYIKFNGLYYKFSFGIPCFLILNYNFLSTEQYYLRVQNNLVFRVNNNKQLHINFHKTEFTGIPKKKIIHYNIIKLKDKYYHIYEKTNVTGKINYFVNRFKLANTSNKKVTMMHRYLPIALARSWVDYYSPYLVHPDTYLVHLKLSI